MGSFWLILSVAMPLFDQFIDGEHESGENVRQQNITAVVAIANVVKTSLGPEGLDKMLVDDVGDICITNDGATILKQLDIEHPAARISLILPICKTKKWVMEPPVWSSSLRRSSSVRSS